MSGYNKNVCEHCGGDHVTRQCPDLEAGSSFAAPTGSDPPDCCAEWARSVGMLDTLCVLSSLHNVPYRGASFNFCPWCGRARPNDKVSDGGPLTHD